MEFSIFRPCLEVTASGVGVSTQADTPPVCSIPKYFNWVKFLRKMPEHLRGDAFWKMQNIDLSHNHDNIDFSTMFEGHDK